MSQKNFGQSHSKNKNEEFDRNSTSTGNIGNNNKGNLLIYFPSFRNNSPNTLIFERKIEEPILQMETRNFSQMNGNVSHSAILLIHKLLIYRFKILRQEQKI